MNLREYIVLNFDKESYNSSDIKELASKFNCTEGHVMRIFRDMGIKSYAKRSTEIRRDYLLNTWANKKNPESISELAEKFNCTPTVIRNDLHNLGLSHLQQSDSSILSSTERDNYLLNVWCKQEFPESSYVLGKRFNCSSTTVLRDIRRYSYPINSKEMRNLCLRFSAKFSVPYAVIVKEFKLARELFDVLNLANL